MNHVTARLKQKVYQQLDPEAWGNRGISPVNKIILTVVILSIIVAVLQSENTLATPFAKLFKTATWCFALFFTAEYAIRIWAITISNKYNGPFGRIKYALTVASVTDFTATAAIWIDLILGIPGIYGVLLRLVRVLRVLTLTRNSAVGVSIRLLIQAVRDRSMELLLSFGFAMMVLLIAATVLYMVEGDIQPEAFGSIPRAMWWAMATLTTVGYGDVYPVTAAGQICASVVAISAIAIVAMPTGIMAAAFSDAFQRLREPEQ